MVGLPASGKTTRAKTLAERRRALRLTPDEWMVIPLFAEPEADGERDVLEGRLIWLGWTRCAGHRRGPGLRVLGRDERSALRSRAR